MPSAEVGIVVRTKDRPALLPRALRSIHEQTHRDFHAIVINDGGDPTAVDQITAQADLGKRLSVLHNASSRGMEAVSNQAITQLDCRYLVIHDDDDSWQPSFLEATTGYLRQPRHPLERGVITHTQLVEERITTDAVTPVASRPFNAWLRAVSFYRLIAQNTFPPISFLYRRSVYEEIGPYNESLPVLGDWEFNLRFLRRYEIGLIPQLLANYHHRVDGPAAYANSDSAAQQPHFAVETRLRNQWLRDYLDAHPSHLGLLSNFAAKEEEIAGIVWHLRESQHPGS